MNTSPTRLVAACAAALALTAGSAGAATIDLSSGSASFGATPIAGGFTNTYDFSLLITSVLSGAVTSVVNGTQDVDFAYIGIVGPAGVYSFTQRLSDPIETWGLNEVTVPAGNYTLTLIGTNSASVGSYAGTLGATPVPEPHTYALMAGGLLAVLALARRRRDH